MWLHASKLLKFRANRLRQEQERIFRFLYLIRRNEAALIINKRVWKKVLECSLKNNRMISVHFQAKPFNIRVIQIYVPTTNAKETEVESFNEDLQEDWNAKVGSQELPGVTGKFGLGIKNEAGQRLIEFCQENALVIANTVKAITTDDSTHGHHQMSTLKSDGLYSLQPKMEKLYTVRKHKSRNLLWLRSWMPYVKIQT